MKTKKNKAGFTLVELMVVAIIVAILAAVTIPLMSGNTERAIATEAQAGCSTIATAIRVASISGNVSTNTAVLDLPGISEGDLDGTYFDDGSYSIEDLTDSGNFEILADGRNDGDAAGQTVTMTVTDGKAVWAYGSDGTTE